jgi:type III restriction enzyme
VREVVKSHLNFVVADTRVWEQAAAYTIDKHPNVAAFAKNAGLGFSIPYLHNGQAHEYIPDFIIRLAGDPDRYMVLETKGFDELADIKAQAADRWVRAVNADGRFGTWHYAMARKPGEIAALLSMKD